MATRIRAKREQALLDPLHDDRSAEAAAIREGVDGSVATVIAMPRPLVHLTIFVFLAFFVPSVVNAQDAACTTATPYPKSGGTYATIALLAPRASLQIQVVDSYETRERGLMCITDLPRDAGMIFVFPVAGRLDFWMKDTRIPLDMIWVASDGSVTSVAANVPRTRPDAPDTEIARRSGEGRYVIELATGEAARAGIRRGTKLTLPRLTAKS